ncbi:hypothetical protein KIW84_075419 [Lathyrus oleraceus]|uniref:Trafficking protein particle complex subunit n=1 Tax=Pisum sativum TaxID=3888 RepID=A0A9D4VWM5_PEA|nr:hypothetical protein KIW84_075419 [Pisum sativum]
MSIPPLAVPVAQVPIIHHRMQIRVKSDFSQPRLEPRLLLTQTIKIGYVKFVVGAITRPDIAYSANKVCQFMSHPLETHWVAVKRILRYLKGTIDLGLYLSPHSPTTLPSLQVFKSFVMQVEPQTLMIGEVPLGQPSCLAPISSPSGLKSNRAEKGNLGVPQLPGQGCSFHSFRTNTYKLSFMETPSGIKIILVTHPRTGDLRDSLKYIYNLYVEYVVKNPLYTPGSPIRSELFNTTLDQYVRGIA